MIDLRAEHGCWLVRTPANPTFYWGNTLLFQRAPEVGDYPRWMALFERLIAAPQPASAHRTFGWIEDAPGEIGPFLAAGFERNDAVVMQATDLPPAAVPAVPVQLRALAGDGDWAQLVELLVHTRAAAHESATYRPFAAQRVAGWRALAARGQGGWFGAWVDERGLPVLAAALGIFVEREAVNGERLARYQSVATAVAYRRRGLCRALLAHAGRHARTALAADRLIIVAMADELPQRIYEGTGFRAAGLQRGLERRPG